MGHHVPYHRAGGYTSSMAMRQGSGGPTRDEILETLRSEAVDRFCRRWKIRMLAVFGSVLRDDFQPDSDVDLLVSFQPLAGWSLFDHVQMQEELSTLVGRPVDLVSRGAVERSSNWIRREAILGTAEAVYVS
jgi:uncharacterized protein